MSNIKIIAEIGCNHNGDIGLARRLMEAAVQAGADGVKFQSFVPELLVSASAPKANYQNRAEESDTQLEMLKKLALSQEEYRQLVFYAAELGTEIFSTPFDMESVKFLEGMSQRVWKIPSGEITNLPMLERIAAIQCPGKQIVLSTGMSTSEEIRRAVAVLSQSADTEFVILHCNTQYPTPPQDMNLRAMTALAELAPGWKIGLSDHSQGTVAAVAAAAMGAQFLEKHFTLDKNLPGPDHMASATPEELARLCADVRQVEQMFGRAEKQVTSSERENLFVARKSIVAGRHIARGEILTPENITCKRPGNGISPMHWHLVLGTAAERDYVPDEQITSKEVAREDEVSCDYSCQKRLKRPSG